MENKLEKKINYKRNWKEYWSYLRKYKFAFFFLLFLVVLVEARSLIERYLFKYLLDYGTQFLSNEVSTNYFTTFLFLAAIIFISSSVIILIANWLKIHFHNRLSANIIFDIKKKYFSHILRLDYNFHTTHKTGSMISKITRGSSAADSLIDTLLYSSAPLVIQFFIVVITVFYLDKTSALIFALISIVFVSYSYIMQRVSEPSNVAANKTEDIERGKMADFMTNIDSIRNFGKEKSVVQNYINLSRNTFSAWIKNWNYWRSISTVQMLITAIGTFFLFYFSIIKFLNGEITIGTLGFIYTSYGALVGPLYFFVYSIRNFSRSMADFQELFDYGEIKREIQDKEDAKTIKIKTGSVEFKEVEFDYGRRKLFKDFNLKVSSNKKVALVGHSGCGKTTLIKLLYRLYDVKKGKILIDGVDVKDVQQESLREEMSVVPQECVLFDDTIYNNIKFSNPSATKKQVLQAMKFAQLDKFVNSLPSKENTIVGERGVKLSGGEKQRVSIARAVLANKKILVLDEATSSLDSETESEIQKDLQKLMKGRTTIIIAHRLSTIMHADEIVVMEKGKIVQRGKHSRLIKQKGQYRKLWNLQKGGFIGE